MPTTSGTLRRFLLTPSLAGVSFAGRGFPAAPESAVRQLESIPFAVICGFEWGIDTREQWELERRLELTEPELRGFAYEGATMALTIRDALGGGGRTRALLRGPGQPHLFLTYIGIGFAMARLPRPLWRKVLPDLDESVYHPTMSWLAVDGYGFDRAYFDTHRWVDRQLLPKPYPWEGAPDYFRRAADQGIGRALWFIHGAQPAAVGAAVARFAAHRRADLWAGVGLAATFAGGCAAAEFAALRAESGEHRPDLGVGVVFAVKARAHSGVVPEYTGIAAAELAGLPVADAVALADDTAVAPRGAGPVPQYEVWRQRIRARLVSAPANRFSG